jgi:DNA (cytosine-5)-methyltransferase 1
MTLRIIDTFSGIGGFSLAARWVGGFQTVQFVEWEPYCQRILAQHFPDTSIHGDISTFFPAAGTADVVCGGFPCQDISTAGKQAGIKQGTRSGLFYELMRVVRTVRPSYVVMENVAAITSNGLGTVLGELAEAGFDAEWACIPASAVGACHQRDRWWLVAYANDSHITAEQQEHRQQWQAAAADGGGDRDAANTEGGRRRTGKGQGASQAGHQEPGAGDHGAGSDAANPNGQRQQEQHPAAIADRSGWPCWGDAPRSLNSDWRSYLSEPILRRGDDGLSGRVDRLKALGNAVVPQVAMIPLQRVLDHHRGQC